MTEKQKEYYREYYKKNKGKYKRYYNDNREKILQDRKENTQANTEYMKKYRNTKIGRANMLLQRYMARDEETNRGECNLTVKWIVDNIFSKPCAHCGVNDWHKIGCNRLDNTKGHTKNNVEPCCKPCNDRLGLEYQWGK